MSVALLVAPSPDAAMYRSVYIASDMQFAPWTLESPFVSRHEFDKLDNTSLPVASGPARRTTGLVAQPSLYHSGVPAELVHMQSVARERLVKKWVNIGSDCVRCAGCSLGEIRES
jgi:hypothetical protein